MIKANTKTGFIPLFFKESGSKLPLYIVIDDQDNTQNSYKDIFGEDKIIIFNKSYYASLIDQYDNLNNLRSTTHARNACFDIAYKLGFKYFLVLDDDYGQFKMRINGKLDHPTGRFKVVKNIDQVFIKTLEYYIKSSYTSICFSQGGDWFGGETNFNKKPKRKAMNSFFCSTDRRFWFVSRLNEDVNTYMSLGHKGYIFLTIPFIQLDQIPTQQTSGGMTDTYLIGGTYIKSFYTILNRPDCTKINIMGTAHIRLHHSIEWDNAVPCIIDEKYKKQ